VVKLLKKLCFNAVVREVYAVVDGYTFILLVSCIRSNFLKVYGYLEIIVAPFTGVITSRCDGKDSDVQYGVSSSRFERCLCCVY